MSNTSEKVRFVYQKELQTSYQTDVRELLCASDKEFIPPLSKRKGTTQQSFSEEKDDNTGLTLYYQQMLQQEFILAIENEKVVGFLTFIPDHILDLESNKYKCDYVSTVIVSSESRVPVSQGKCIMLFLRIEKEQLCYKNMVYQLFSYAPSKENGVRVGCFTPER